MHPNTVIYINYNLFFSSIRDRSFLKRIKKGTCGNNNILLKFLLALFYTAKSRPMSNPILPFYLETGTTSNTYKVLVFLGIFSYLMLRYYWYFKY